MRVLVCPDKFAGTISAPAVAAALIDGWRRERPNDQLTARPLADGGPGFLDVVVAGERRSVAVTGPIGEPVRADIVIDGDRAYLEAAQACGLHLLSQAERDPRTTTTYGLGELVTVAGPVAEVVIGLGGSGTNDCGAGMLAALGAVAVDDAGRPLPPGGAALARCAAVSVPSGRVPSLVGAADVDNPLTGPAGATAVFGPQKGVRPADIPVLDAALGHFATVLERDLPTCPAGLAELPGAGAAGGLGAAILALGGRLESGFALVGAMIRLDEALAGCDLVITGEGSFDEQSLRGKVAGGVAEAARDRGVPCLIVAGRVEVGARAAGVTQTYALVDEFGRDAALNRPAECLAQLGARLAQQWSR